MSSPTEWISNLASAGGGIIGGAVDYKQSKENLAFQREQFEYQKQLNQLQMEREDTAHQREAADLEAAGLSKTLTAGGGSGSSTASLHSAPAPQRQADTMNRILQGMQIGQNFAQLKKIQAETANIGMDADYKAEQINNLREERAGQEIANAIANRNLLNYNLNTQQLEANIALTLKQIENIGFNQDLRTSELDLSQKRYELDYNKGVVEIELGNKKISFTEAEIEKVKAETFKYLTDAGYTTTLNEKETKLMETLIQQAQANLAGTLISNDTKSAELSFFNTYGFKPGSFNGGAEGILGKLGTQIGNGIGSLFGFGKVGY